MNYEGYLSEGSRTGAAFTRKWASVAAGPPIVQGAEDTWDTLVLDKAPPCPLHLGVLFTNDPLNHLEKTWPEIKPVLKELFGIQPHSYQGKERNFAGPEIRKMLAGLHKLYPLMRADPIRSLYLDVFIGIRNVKSALLGVKLQPNWRECLDQLKSALLALNAATEVSILPLSFF